MTRTKKNIKSTKKNFLFKHVKQNKYKYSQKYKLNKFNKLNKLNNVSRINNNKKKTQKGGNIFRHWRNMAKFKKFIKNFQNEEKKITKVIGSYKVNASTFKQIAEGSRDNTTNYILNKRQLTIIDMTKQSKTDISFANKTDKDYLKTVISAHDLEMIENKTKRLELEINQSQKTIDKNLSEFIKDKVNLEKRTKKFRDLVEKFSDSDIGKFNAKVKLMKQEYENIKKEKKETLKSIHKKALKKYTRHESDYEKVIKINDAFIDKQQKTVHEIDDLLESAEFYIEQMSKLEGKKETINKDIIIWDKTYREIYNVLKKIIDTLKKTIKQIEEIKQYELKIDMSIHPIAQNRIKTTMEDIIIKESSSRFKNLQKELDNVVKFLNACLLNINEILDKLLNEKMASELYLDSTKIVSTLEYVHNILLNYKTIFSHISTNQDGGASSRRARISGPSKKKATGNLTIHPICYKRDNNNGYHDIYSRLKINKKMLFIYNDYFENYANGSIEQQNGLLRFRTFRRDLHVNPFEKDKQKEIEEELKKTNTKYKDFFHMQTLGIPTVINNIASDKDDSPISKDKYDLKSSNIKILDTDEQTLLSKKQYSDLFEISIKNIYNYIIKNKITDVYYTGFDGDCNKNTSDPPNLRLNINKSIDGWTIVNSNNIQLQCENLIEELIKKGFKIENDNGIDTSTTTSPDLTIPLHESQTSITEIPLSGYTIKNNVLVDSNGYTINVKTSSKAYYDEDNQKITINDTNKPFKIKNGMIAKVLSDGTIFIDPNVSENSPIRSILSTIHNINNDNQYNDNIKVIEENVVNINKILDDTVKDSSEFMELIKNVKSLSQNLIDLKFIEPKLIKVDYDKPPALSVKYPWILKPVELIKSELHGLKGTDVLDKLIKENKEAQKIVTKNSYISDDIYNHLIDLLSSGNPTYSEENKQNMNKITSNDENLNYLITKIKSKNYDQRTLCTISHNVVNYTGPYKLGNRIIDNSLCKKEQEKNKPKPRR